MIAALHDSDQWRPCPPSELHRIVARERTQQRRRVLKKLGGTAAGLLVLGSGGYVANWWLSEAAECRYGGIACSEVMRLLPDYREKKLGAVLSKKIAAHLGECLKCGPMYRRGSAYPIQGAS